MGATCATPAGAEAPTFLVAAMKDPLSGNLDRIQIVKGWLERTARARRRSYNVVWGDPTGRKIGGNGKLPAGRTTRWT